MALSSSSAPDAAPESADLYRVIVVDDSLFARRFIARVFDSDPAFKVVATAGNGIMAVNALRREPADVVLLDIEMPAMDGLTAIAQLKAVDPAVQIIMVSTLTHHNAEISLRALALGATDYIPKPSTDQSLNAAGDFKRALLEKSRALSLVARREGVRRGGKAAPVAQPVAEPKKSIKLREGVILKPEIIAIGASTGGPQALFEVVKKMGAGLPQPTVIVQHMPPAFTTILSEHITRQCGVVCHEARDGETLGPGHYYVAPGDYHMLVARRAEKPAIILTKDPAENYCRPALDPMLRSLAEVYGKRVTAIILTGMGQDGWNGCEAIARAGGGVIAQDESTSVVWGMPGAVAQAGLCSSVLPLGEIGTSVRELALGTEP